jgi:hypothetical protein
MVRRRSTVRFRKGAPGYERFSNTEPDTSAAEGCHLSGTWIAVKRRQRAFRSSGASAERFPGAEALSWLSSARGSAGSVGRNGTSCDNHRSGRPASGMILPARPRIPGCWAGVSGQRPRAPRARGYNVSCWRGTVVDATPGSGSGSEPGQTAGRRDPGLRAVRGQICRRSITRPSPSNSRNRGVPVSAIAAAPAAMSASHSRGSVSGSPCSTRRTARTAF